MLFSFSFAIIVLLHLGVHGQGNDNFRVNNLEKGYPFGKLRIFEDGKNEELISTNVNEKISSKSDSSSGVQPLPSPCVGASSGIKLVHPKDKTKYIQCRDEFHYEIFTCPNGGNYNEQTNSCDLTVPIIDRCEQEKPCFNDGQCTLLGNATFKCNCRADWTGERCETPINSCVKKPCGPNAECRPLKTSDYEQDYICVCHGTRSYGLNCQETVSNPCLSMSENFFPYAFSQRAYIQCDGELIYFQPCGPSLYWNQEDKICDRKKPAKIDLPTLLTKYAAEGLQSQQDQEIKSEGMNIITTTSEKPEQNKKFTNDNEVVVSFVPARVGHRQQLQNDANRQQTLFGQNGVPSEQQTQELQRPSIESSPIRQDFNSRTKQWPNRQTESNNLRQPAAALLSNPSQSWSTNTEQRTRTLSDESKDFDANEVSINENQQQKNFPQQKQIFVNQQELNQVPEKNTQNNQRFPSNSQTFQGVSNQPIFQDQNQKILLETTTKTTNIVPEIQDTVKQNRPEKQFTGFQSPQPGDFGSQNFAQQPASWQPPQSFQNQFQTFVTTTPMQSVAQIQGSHNFNTQFPGSQPSQSINFPSGNNPNFGVQPQAQPWPGSQTIQNQRPILGTTTFPTNVNPFPGFQNPNTQTGVNQMQPSTGFHSQNLVGQQPSWQNPQAFPNQQPFFQTSTFATNVNQLPGFQKPPTQGSGNQMQQPGGFHSQNFAGQQPSWQNPQTFPSHQPFIETATIPSNINNGFPGFQNPSIPFNGNQGSQIGGFNTQNFNPQVQPWKKQNQQPMTETTTEASTTVSSPVVQTSTIIQQDQSWQNKLNAPLARNQFTPTASFTSQNNQNFPSKQQSRPNIQPFSSNDQQSNTMNFEEPIVDNSKNSLNNGFQQNDRFTSEKQNLPQQNQAFGTQQWSNKVPSQNFQSNQRLNDQSEFQNLNQQNVFSTTSIPSNINRFQGLQKPDSPVQPIQNQLNNNPSAQIFAFKPKPRQDTPKQVFNTFPSSENRNTQFQNQENPIVDSDDSSIQTTTIANRQVLPMVGSRNWQSNQVQTTGEQRKPLDPLPSILSGSWKSRV